MLKGWDQEIWNKNFERLDWEILKGWDWGILKCWYQEILKG